MPGHSCNSPRGTATHEGQILGVRGSIPCPGPKTVKYGGNTTCVEIRADSGRLLIVDAGTGIRALGEHLIRSDIKDGLRELDIFLSHTHWDHILGFPFLRPCTCRA